MSFRVDKTKDPRGHNRYKVYYKSKAGKESLVAVNFNGYCDQWFFAKWLCDYEGIERLLTKELRKYNYGYYSARYEYSLEKTITYIDSLTDYALEHCFRF